MRILRRAFFARPTSVVARALLGKVLVRQIGRRVLAGRIVETEAYMSGDPASHAFRGRTERNRALFGEVGYAYIYQTHGYVCLNIVAKKGGPAGGVLVRALEPLDGIGARRGRSGWTGDPRIMSGPGKLARAMSIGKRLYGADLTKNGPLYIGDDGAAKPDVRRTPRIGVTAAREKRWRFVVESSPFITRPRLR
ncbi:MAG TPA: DNA-3-methyladenine glycosylase [Acidobacteriota bacterium]|nr:DNA-3-methyladenine glycosylase [Acidobacteriota bacterium]